MILTVFLKTFLTKTCKRPPPKEREKREKEVEGEKAL